MNDDPNSVKAIVCDLLYFVTHPHDYFKPDTLIPSNDPADLNARFKRSCALSVVDDGLRRDFDEFSYLSVAEQRVRSDASYWENSHGRLF